MAELLRSDVPGSQRTTIQMMVGQFYEAWGGLIDSIRTGRPAFESIHGRSFFDHLAEHQDQAQIFDDAMTARNDRKTRAMLDVYDLTGVGVLADIGGGNGSTLVTVLKQYPEMRGILFDRPGVVERARAGIERAGLRDRCQIVGGSFLERVPGGADAYLLRHILHNWDDEHALAILERVHEAMGDHAKLLIVDRIIPPGNEPMFGKIMDLNMLVMLGGVERTEDEFRDLFGLAGFRVSRIVRDGGGGQCDRGGERPLNHCIGGWSDDESATIQSSTLRPAVTSVRLPWSKPASTERISTWFFSLTTRT